ncbi:hypothetical protein [Vibrio parahaemolyticus]|uniref:hypothetical protein n=1 Tax=Vibrio parahaemolyticus TaxID=670 RepID=UPI00111CF2A2|nr:hypothetical protein [Vibrio parahaemolyticus]ELA9344243.1 hypothetical protein [Vibrio parahaemolyticus]ELA9345343.1 hypothetical protein [Vibrio parahaemolyticus]MBE3927106.1 hypothetical protein [Vibrio parahaemolyticus]MBE4360103.1 hypothetical protein [Vibrio parahaemolyticus]TOM80693.1 hypothetical protein CGH69_22830 [Vibrio parahaemolyticus]
MNDVLTIKASNHLDTQTLLTTQDSQLHQEVWGHVKALVELGVFEVATNGIENVLAPYMAEVNAELI